MPHLDQYDLTLDSEDEEHMEDSEEEKLRKRKMLVEEYLEENDAKLEQENARKLEKERLERGVIPKAAANFADNINQQVLPPENSKSGASETLIFDLDISSNPRLKAKSVTGSVFQTASQIKPSRLISRRAFAMSNNLVKNVNFEAPQVSARKAFVCISQAAAPTKVRIRGGNVTQVEPVSKNTNQINNNALDRLEDVVNIMDPFSDLPCDLLPGLNELPNLGFDKGPDSDSMTTGVKEDSVILNKCTSLINQEKHIQGASGKLPDKTDHTYLQRKTPNQLSAFGELEHFNCSQLVESKASNDTVNNLEIADDDDDGPYVVLVIPKHATVDDVMRVLKKAGKQPAHRKEILHKIISKRKSPNSSRKTSVKRKKQEEIISPTAVKKEGPTVTEVSNSVELNASSTLAAMSMLAAAEKSEKGIPNTSAISGNMDVSINETEPVDKCERTIEDDVEGYVSHSSRRNNKFQELEQGEPFANSGHILFGLFNDHTYYATPEPQYPVSIEKILEIDEIPYAGALVTVKTEVMAKDVADDDKVVDVNDTEDFSGAEVEEEVMEIKIEEDRDKEDEINGENEIEEMDGFSEEIEEQESREETDEEEGDFVFQDDTQDQDYIPFKDDYGDCDNSTCIRRSRRLCSRKRTTISNPCKSKHKKCNNEEPKKCKKPNLNRSKKRSKEMWRLFPSKYRCRLCKVMCRKLVELKEHILQIHSNQKTPMSEKRNDRVFKKKMGKINLSSVLSDFEVSALSAVVRLCPTCDKYVPETRISIHLDNHAPHDAFCELCGVTCENRKQLANHRLGCKMANTVWRCQICAKEFSCKFTLAAHTKSKHKLQQKRKYQCDRCEKEFKTSKDLKIHIAIHFTVKLYECAQCGIGFSQKRNLVHHSRVHTGDE